MASSKSSSAGRKQKKRATASKSQPKKAKASTTPSKPAAAGTEPTMPERHWAREYLEALLIAGIFLGFSNTFVVKTFYIPSGSMETTLLIGDHLFVNRFLFGASPTAVEQSLLPARDVERGDIVIFRSPQEPTTDLVKRCIATGGDTVEIRAKTLYINGTEVDDDSYTQHLDPRVFPNRRSPLVSAEMRQRDNFGPYTVPDDHYFFLGDNRDRSYDSRYWGPVPEHLVKGRALMIYWSNGGETADGQWDSLGKELERTVGTARGFFASTRWDRTFHLVR